MKRFDVDAINNGADQVWSALGLLGSEIKGEDQSSVFGNLTLSAEPTKLHRQITVDSGTCLSIGDYELASSTPEMLTFSLALLFVPKDTDMWIFRFNTGIISNTYSDVYSDVYDVSDDSKYVGVRMNNDFTISLIWTLRNRRVEARLICDDAPSLLTFKKSEGEVSLQINDKQVVLDCDDYEVSNFTMGIREDESDKSIQVDKIVIAQDGHIPSINKYATLFRSQHIDRVARPGTTSSFIYLAENNIAKTVRLTKPDFDWEDGYAYAAVRNSSITALFSIDKRAGFYTEYSLDNGLSWFELPNYLALSEYYPNIIIRYDTNSDTDYHFDVRLTDLLPLPAAHFSVELDGVVHAPDSIGYGYYDATLTDASNGTVIIESESTDIKSVEIVYSGNLITDQDTNIASKYINGSTRSLETNNQEVFHAVLVLNDPVQTVSINPDKDQQIFIVGVGASVEEYTESDAYYIYNSFAANTYVSCMETASGLKDGVSPNSLSSEPASALSLEWNS